MSHPKTSLDSALQSECAKGKKTGHICIREAKVILHPSCTACTLYLRKRETWPVFGAFGIVFCLHLSRNLRMCWLLSCVCWSAQCVAMSFCERYVSWTVWAPECILNTFVFLRPRLACAYRKQRAFMDLHRPSFSGSSGTGAARQLEWGIPSGRSFSVWGFSGL